MSNPFLSCLDAVILRAVRAEDDGDGTVDEETQDDVLLIANVLFDKQKMKEIQKLFPQAGRMALLNSPAGEDWTAEDVLGAFLDAMFQILEKGQEWDEGHIDPDTQHELDTLLELLDPEEFKALLEDLGIRPSGRMQMSLQLMAVITSEAAPAAAGGAPARVGKQPVYSDWTHTTLDRATSAHPKGTAVWRKGRRYHYGPTPPKERKAGSVDRAAATPHSHADLVKLATMFRDTPHLATADALHDYANQLAQMKLKDLHALKKALHEAGVLEHATAKGIGRTKKGESATKKLAGYLLARVKEKIAAGSGAETPPVSAEAAAPESAAPEAGTTAAPEASSPAPAAPETPVPPAPEGEATVPAAPKAPKAKKKYARKSRRKTPLTPEQQAQEEAQKKAQVERAEGGPTIPADATREERIQFMLDRIEAEFGITHKGDPEAPLQEGDSAAAPIATGVAALFAKVGVDWFEGAFQEGGIFEDGPVDANALTEYFMHDLGPFIDLVMPDDKTADDEATAKTDDKESALRHELTREERHRQIARKTIADGIEAGYLEIKEKEDGSKAIDLTGKKAPVRLVSGHDATAPGIKKLEADLDDEAERFLSEEAREYRDEAERLLAGRDKTEVEPKVEPETLRERVLDLLAKEPQTVKDVAKALKIKEYDARQILIDLNGKGEVDSAVKGGISQWRLSGAAPAPPKEKKAAREPYLRLQNLLNISPSSPERIKRAFADLGLDDDEIAAVFDDLNDKLEHQGRETKLIDGKWTIVSRPVKKIYEALDDELADAAMTADLAKEGARIEEVPEPTKSSEEEEPAEEAEPPAPLADTGKLPDGKPVKFVKNKFDNKRVLVMVDPAKLDAAWAKDRGGYLPTEGRGESEIEGRRDIFRRFLETGVPIEASSVQFKHDDPDAATFNDGRHRFAVLRDLGISAIGITVPKKEAQKFRDRYGAAEPAKEEAPTPTPEPKEEEVPPEEAESEPAPVLTGDAIAAVLPGAKKKGITVAKLLPLLGTKETVHPKFPDSKLQVPIYSESEVELALIKMELDGTVERKQNDGGEDIYRLAKKKEPAAPAPKPPEPKPLEPAQVLASFDQLDADSGGNNFVRLADLRKSLAAQGVTDRAEQDRLIVSMQGKELTLSAHEGRHGGTEEDRAMRAGGLRGPDGTLFTAVSRREQPKPAAKKETGTTGRSAVVAMAKEQLAALNARMHAQTARGEERYYIKHADVVEILKDLTDDEIGQLVASQLGVPREQQKRHGYGDSPELMFNRDELEELLSSAIELNHYDTIDIPERTTSESAFRPLQAAAKVADTPFEVENILRARIFPKSVVPAAEAWARTIYDAGDKEREKPVSQALDSFVRRTAGGHDPFAEERIGELGPRAFMEDETPAEKAEFERRAREFLTEAFGSYEAAKEFYGSRDFETEAIEENYGKDSPEAVRQRKAIGKKTPAKKEAAPAETASPVLKPQDREEFLRDVISVMRGKDDERDFMRPELATAARDEAKRRLASHPLARKAIDAAEKDWETAKAEAQEELDKWLATRVQSPAQNERVGSPPEKAGVVDWGDEPEKPKPGVFSETERGQRMRTFVSQRNEARVAIHAEIEAIEEECAALTRDMETASNNGARKMRFQLTKASARLDDKRQELVAKREEDRAAFLEEFAAPTSGTMTIQPPEQASAETQLRCAEAASFINRIAAGATVGVHVAHDDGRAMYRPGQNMFNAAEGDEAWVYIHELGHHLEWTIPEIRKAGIAFQKMRTFGHADVNLQEIFPWYTAKEQGNDDDFGRFFKHSEAYYCGKVYRDSSGKITGTEIISMGVQALYQDPRGFMEADPQYAEFIIGILSHFGVKKDEGA